MGLILDSSVLIRAERSGLSVSELLLLVVNVTGDQDAAISSIGLTEIVQGLFRAITPDVRLARQEFIDEVLANFKVYPYLTETAMLAGEIDGEQTAKGNKIPFADLLIGATALSLGYSVLTTNMRHFRMIPGLNVIPF